MDSKQACFGVKIDLTISSSPRPTGTNKLLHNNYSSSSSASRRSYFPGTIFFARYRLPTAFLKTDFERPGSAAAMSAGNDLSPTSKRIIYSSFSLTSRCAINPLSGCILVQLRISQSGKIHLCEDQHVEWRPAFIFRKCARSWREMVTHPIWHEFTLKPSIVHVTALER